MRGSGEVLEDIKADLRAYEPLVSLLADEESIYIGHPTDDRGKKAAVTLTTVFEGSQNHRGAVTRRFRFQATVKTTREWREGYDSRENQPASLTQQSKILSRVADRMDQARGVKEVSQGGEGGPEPQEMDDGRLAMPADWVVAGTYITD